MIRGDGGGVRTLGMRSNTQLSALLRLRRIIRAGRYDVVHTCSFPYFSLLSAAIARPLWRYRLAVDWFELWSASYWREYLGGIGGRAGLTVQRICARVRQPKFFTLVSRTSAPSAWRASYRGCARRSSRSVVKSDSRARSPIC